MTSVAIIGTGFGGLAAAVRLQQAGVDDLVLFEKSADVGGVWRDNTYPGAACDVPSHLYSLSFAPRPDWSRRFAPQAEIHQYLRDVARDFDVLRHIRFGTEVLAAAFDEGTGRWRLTLAGGGEHEADVLITATGQLSRPSTPDIPGLDSFEGTVFHSAQWDHDHDLRGERVAVLGTGASAIQFVPAIAPRTARLAVFQRSAPYVLAKPDRAYRARALRRFRRVPGLLRLSREANYFSNELRSLGFNTEPRLLFAHRARFREHLARQVPDPDLRQKLTPTDPMGCKRILMSNDWYPALQLPQVEVVDDRISEVRPHSIVTADGTERPVDTIVLGTGFAATEFLAPMTITGRRRPRPARAVEGRRERATSAPSSPASRTCSCCTAPTPTSGTTRSWSCSRRRSAGSCRRCGRSRDRRVDAAGGARRTSRPPSTPGCSGGWRAPCSRRAATAGT